MPVRASLYCFLICFINSVYCKQETQVFQLAQEKNRPIVAFFLGARGCPWSQKLQGEVLETVLFQEKMAQEAVLWQVSFEESMRLQKYPIQSYPQILLLDPQGKEFARLDYLVLDAEGYATQICNLIDDFNEICIALDRKIGSFNEEKWQELFQKAQKLSAPCFKQIILDRGVELEKGNYFHLEKFASLLEVHKLKKTEVMKFKKKLFERDPKNLQGTHLKVAILAFQKLASRVKPSRSYEKALAPLLEYIEKFGETDPNLWRIEMMIADYLFVKKDRDLALEYARAALAAAPDADKLKIAETITYMRELQNSPPQQNRPFEPLCRSTAEPYSPEYALGGEIRAAWRPRQIGSKSSIFLEQGVLQFPHMQKR